MEFVPSNIIKTPDFGAMAQNAMQQKRQDINEMNNWMDSNKKKEGAYLEGDKPAVQEAWNKYQEELDRAVESGNRDARRKADEAYGSYVQIAGTALSLSEQYRSQVAAYKTDPSKFSISGQEFLSLTDQYRRTRRSANDIAEAAQNPFVIAQSMKYDLSNPLDQAGKMVQMSAAKVKDFYDAQGNLDTEALRNYADDLATATINANETSLEKAMAWGGVRSGYAGGEDGMINSMEELEFLRNQTEEKRQEFIDSYKNELVNNYVNLLSNKKKEDSGKKKLYTDTVSLQAAGGEDVEFITLPGDINGITQIGAAPNGEIFITVEERVKTGEIDDKGNEVYETKVEYRPATQTEVSKILSKYGNTYDFSALNVQPQQQTAQPAAEQPAAEQAADKPKDTLGLGIFDTPEPPVETEQAAVETEESAEPDVAKTATQNVQQEQQPVVEEPREYIVINGQNYFKDDYDKIAGKKTGRGNYPDTFEEYAETMNVDIFNTEDRPLTTMLDEVTVTAERSDIPVSKEAVVPIQGGGTVNKKESSKVEESNELESLNTDSYYEHLLGAEGGKTSDPRDNAAGVAGNSDAPLDPSDPKGKRRFHTNKGLQYAKFKEWAKKTNIPESEWHDRFLNLTDKEVRDVVDDYTKSSGSDNFESQILRALFTSNSWGSGKIFRADFNKKRSSEYRAIVDWLQDSTGVNFNSTVKLSKEEAKAIEDFYNKDPKGFVREFTKRRKIHNKTLDDYKTFGRGWDKRAKDLERALLSELRKS